MHLGLFSPVHISVHIYCPSTSLSCVTTDSDRLIDLAVLYVPVASRGGVEDTRLEAKAKDTKKSEAKDNPSEDIPSRI